MVLKLGHFVIKEQKYLEVLNVVQQKDGEVQLDWRVKNGEYYKESRMKGTSYIHKKRRKANWIGQILGRNCLLEQVIEGKVEGTRWLRRRKQLLSNLREKRWHWNWKEEALNGTAEWQRLWTSCTTDCRPMFCNWPARLSDLCKPRRKSLVNCMTVFIP